MFCVPRTPGALGSAVLSFSSLLALTGCGLNVVQNAAVASSGSTAGERAPGFLLHGNVHGGLFPIQYATIRLMETQTNGYGGAAKQIAVAESDTHGDFNFSNSVTCDAGQYAYVTVSSGQTISGDVNNNVIQIGVIGSCSTDLANPQNVNLFVSELSTIAAAYALGNFITISPNDASGVQIVNISAPANNNATTPGCNAGNTMSCQASGLGNGFANAFNLVDSVRYDGTTPTGQANSTFLNGANSQAVVPQALINALGNILQTCVDSAGGAGSPCVGLFADATPPNGTAPQNTLQVALNMARYPTNNVDALFNLQAPSVPFTPTMTVDTIGSTGPVMSLTISIFYTGTGLTGDGGIAYPIDVALDGENDALVLYSKDGTGTSYAALDGFAPNGTGLFAGAQQTAVANPMGLAIDSTGDAWVTNDTNNGGVVKIPTSGKNAGTVSKTVTVSNGYAAGVALDMNDNLWVSRDSTDGNQSLFRLAATANYDASLLLFAPILRASAKRIVLDSSQNVWGVTGSDTAFGFGYGANSLLSVLETASLGGSGGFGLAVTQGLEAYFPVDGQVHSAGGSTISGINVNTAGTATVSGAAVPMGVEIDGAGNIFWTDFESGGQVFMLTPSTGTGAVTTSTLPGGTTIAFQPCFVVSLQCHVSSTGTNLRGMAIDSSGAMWYVANSSDYKVVQTLGLAAPTWPLLSYAHAGSPVQ